MGLTSRLNFHISPLEIIVPTCLIVQCMTSLGSSNHCNSRTPVTSSWICAMIEHEKDQKAYLRLPCKSRNTHTNNDTTVCTLERKHLRHTLFGLDYQDQLSHFTVVVAVCKVSTYQSRLHTCEFTTVVLYSRQPCLLAVVPPL